MKLKIHYFIISLLLTVLSGCTASQKPDNMSQTMITSKNYGRITGMQWILKKMTVDGLEYPLSREVPFIKFGTNGKVSGFASINQFFGSVVIDSQGQVIWSKAFGSTRMAGPEKLMNQENAFFKALPKTEELAFKGIHLYAYSKDRQTECNFYVPVK